MRSSICDPVPTHSVARVQSSTGLSTMHSGATYRSSAQTVLAQARSTIPHCSIAYRRVPYAASVLDTA
eukprot:92761-Rhodomonas_salina.1